MNAPATVYDRMCWPPGELERALAAGAHHRELLAYLGEAEYALLTQLAQQALATAPASHAPTIYLLPGILGSQLGRARSAGEPVDLLWVDPDDIVGGRLTELALDAAPLQPLGGVVYSYLPLKLRLMAAGFNVVVHDYDWRRDLRQQAELLAERMQHDGACTQVLVGHSMGGLLARATLAQLMSRSADARVTRVIGLGTPHAGAMAAVQALRAVYPVVCRLAAIDRLHDAAALTQHVFRHFISVYQLLPLAAGELDLFEPASWPDTGPVPEPALLQQARGLHCALAPFDQRSANIIGIGQRTVTDVSRRDDQFCFTVSSAGDGTVAVESAAPAGVANYSLRCEHSRLPRHELIATALVDLIVHGRTSHLRQAAPPQPGRVVSVTESALRRAMGRKIDWHSLGIEARRRYLNRLNVPPSAYRPKMRHPRAAS